MLKNFVFLGGLTAGIGGVAAWLLSEPGDGESASAPRDRLELLRRRLREAIAEGNRAGQETQNKLRHELDAYRRHPDRPGTSL